MQKVSGSKDMKWSTHTCVGIDEAGYGCLAGPTSVGLVVLPLDVDPDGLRVMDSKRIKTFGHEPLAKQVKAQALAWAVVYAHPAVIDQPGLTSKSSLLSSKMKAIHYGIDLIRGIRTHSEVDPGYEVRGYKPLPEDHPGLDLIMMDGNTFYEYPGIPHVTMVKGDAKEAAISAASIVAKSSRDIYMRRLVETHPFLKDYEIEKNVGYWRRPHADALKAWGYTAFHRWTYKTCKEESFPRTGLGEWSGGPLPRPPPTSHSYK